MPGGVLLVVPKDPSFGSGIPELLLQSHLRVAGEDGKPGAHRIDLLPALPSAWPKGSITGLVARGGFEVDLSWDGGQLTRAVVRSRLGNPCRLKYGDRTVDLTLKPGESYTFSPQSHAAR